MAYDESTLLLGMSVLEEQARRGELITYKDFATKVPGIGPRGATLGNFLGELSRRSFDTRGVLIAALVVSKSTELPTGDFFSLFAELRPDDMPSDEKTLARREKYRVFDAYR